MSSMKSDLNSRYLWVIQYQVYGNLQNLIKYKKVKIAKFGTFILRNKSSRIGRNPKTKENKIISERKVILFKPSKELKKSINFIE